jgi:endo-1,4-beta-xylanase
MNFKRIGIIFIIALFVFGCKPEAEPEIPAGGTVLLTVGASKNLTTMLSSGMKGTITWSSSNSSKVSVSSGGIATAVITSFSSEEGGNKKYTDGPARAEVIVTAKTSDNKTQEFKVIATTEAQEKIMDLPPLKDRFPPNFLVGNIASSSFSSGSPLARHFNALTSENSMKPNAIAPSQGSYNWSSDSFVDSARASGFKVIGHTLLWHSQIPSWQTNIGSDKTTALAAMKTYITDVVTHFKGRIYSWDVLNEAFPDSGISAGSDWKTSIRQENPWFKAIGSDFVYEGFLAARLADPDAILYYNDYNTDNSNRATIIRNMVKAVNDKYLAAPSADKPVGEDPARLLIEGIGMQEHHNTGVSAGNVRNTLTMFKALGVKVSVTELDVLAQGWGNFSPTPGSGANKQGQSTVTNNGLLTQADLYRQFMAVYKDYADIIERISFWGVTDNQSWRSAGLPLLFDKDGKAKPAYYKFVGAIPTTW